MLRSHQWRTAENSAGYLLDAFDTGRACARRRAADRARSRSTSRSGSRPDASSASTAPTRCSTPRARRHATRASTPSSSRWATCTRSTSPTRRSTWCTRTRCSSTSPIRSPRCGRCDGCCAPDGVVAVRDSDYATFTWWPEDPRLDALARAVPRGGAEQRRRTRRRPAPARVGARGRVHARSTPARRRGASPRRRTVRGGAGCGPTASWRRRSPTRPSTGGFATRDELEEISAAWRAWSDSPDAWFAIVHGEVRARPDSSQRQAVTGGPS